MKYIFNIITLLVLATLFANAQQDVMFTHYMYNTVSINPAYAGSRDALTIIALNRSQWVGFDGAPVTQTISVNSPLFSKSTGLGLTFVNDKIGPLTTSYFVADFSYRIKFKKSYLAFGLKAGTSIVKLGLTDLNTSTASDPAFANNLKSNIVPNFGAGIYYYSDVYYFGFSIPKFLQSNPFDRTQQGVVEQKRHYYFIAGMNYRISENWKLFPSTFIKMVPAAPMEFDITVNSIYKDKYSLGLMYRTGDAMGVLVGWNIMPNLLISYSFDWSMVNKTFAYNSGSHEIMLRYDFYLLPEKKIHSPRYF